MMGHTLGAAGGLEAIVCAQVLRYGEIPPTLNLENPALEDGCNLNYCPGKKVGSTLRHGLGVSAGCLPFPFGKLSGRKIESIRY